MSAELSRGKQALSEVEIARRATEYMGVTAWPTVVLAFAAVAACPLERLTSSLPSSESPIPKSEPSTRRSFERPFRR